MALKTSSYLILGLIRGGVTSGYAIKRFIEQQRMSVFWATTFALTVLADARLHARPRQQHTDLQDSALRAPDLEGPGGGEQAHRANPCGEGTSRHGELGHVAVDLTLT